MECKQGDSTVSPKATDFFGLVRQPGRAPRKAGSAGVGSVSVVWGVDARARQRESLATDVQVVLLLGLVAFRLGGLKKP